MIKLEGRAEATDPRRDYLARTVANRRKKFKKRKPFKSEFSPEQGRPKFTHFTTFIEGKFLVDCLFEDYRLLIILAMMTLPFTSLPDFFREAQPSRGY